MGGRGGGRLRLELGCLGCASGWARDLNDRRWVVGTANYGTPGDRAFLWTPTGGTEILPLLAGDTQSAAYGINNWNQVVGYSWGPAGALHAFVWTRRDGTRSLGTLPGHGSSRAFGINDHGQVVGSSGIYAWTTLFPFAASARAVVWQLESVVVSILNDAPTLSLSSPGIVRLLLLSGDGLDAMQIDPGSLRLGDQLGADTPPAVDGKGSPLAYAKDANGDGLPDLVVEFPIAALVKNGDLTKETTELLLTGTTMQGASVIRAARVVVVP